MKNGEVKKEAMKERIQSLEKEKESYYNRSTGLENELKQLWEKSYGMFRQMAEYNKKAEILDSYAEYLEYKLVIEALMPFSYSIENFDFCEKDRLVSILKGGDETLFEWYVNKKKEGFEFGALEPLHKIMKEDYEEFCEEKDRLLKAKK